jgi:hemoglobin
LRAAALGRSRLFVFARPSAANRVELAEDGRAATASVRECLSTGDLAVGHRATSVIAVMNAKNSIYDQIGGFDVVLALCRRWHALCLQDPVAAHPFEHEIHPQHDERLAAYLSEAFGGPALYTAGYGDETHVQRIPAGHGVHTELDEACLAKFDQALKDVGITGQPAERISSYFRSATEAQRVWAADRSAVPSALPFRYAQ